MFLNILSSRTYTLKALAREWRHTHKKDGLAGGKPNVVKHEGHAKCIRKTALHTTAYLCEYFLKMSECWLVLSPPPPSRWWICFHSALVGDFNMKSTAPPSPPAPSPGAAATEINLGHCHQSFSGFIVYNLDLVQQQLRSTWDTATSLSVGSSFITSTLSSSNWGQPGTLPPVLQWVHRL
jgi:hypothetical protein